MCNLKLHTIIKALSVKTRGNKPLKFGGHTCQYHYGFPYTPLVENIRKLNPDILYFSGDQIYEGNGGYPIKREPADVSIVNLIWITACVYYFIKERKKFQLA
jgi:phosphodiesterase/alkaline phosphatase D-like protein